MRTDHLHGPRLRALAYVLRGGLCYLAFLGVLHLTQYLLTRSWSGNVELMFFEDIVFLGVRIAIVPFLFYSIARVLALCDNYGYELTGKLDEQGYAVRWREVIGSPAFFLQAMTLLALYAALPLRFGWGECLTALPWALPVDGWIAKGMLAPVMALFIGLLALAHRSARHEWQRIRHRREGAGYRARAKKRLRAYFDDDLGLVALLARLLLIAVLYAVGSIVAAVVLIVILPLLRLLLQYWYVFPIALAVLLIPDYLISLRKRRRLLVGLRRICGQKGFVLSPIRTPYLSLLFDRKGGDFTVTAGDRVYECKLLTHHAFPMMRFGNDGTLEHILSLKFRFMMRGRAFARSQEMGLPFLKRKATYAFESDHQKLLIVCPVPAHTLIASVGGDQPLDTGAHIGEYRMFNTTGFLGALERDCLDR